MLWYYPIYYLLVIVSRLPIGVQHAVSDILFFVIYHLYGYRRKVVRENLHRSFPEKSPSERRLIEKNFFVHLSDYIIESTATLGMSKEVSQKRFRYINPECLDAYFKRGQSVLIALGHYGNWEWLNNFPLTFRHQLLGIYKPQKNKQVDELFIRLREKWGMKAIPMTTSLKYILQYQRKGIPTATLFLTDQRPYFSAIEYWTTFLNQETPVYLGIAKVAKKLGYPIVFLNIRKKERGYYECEFVKVCDHPSEHSVEEITELHVRALERLIREKPDYWLWSHKRWKYDRAEVEQWQREHKAGHES